MHGVKKWSEFDAEMRRIKLLVDIFLHTGIFHFDFSFWVGYQVPFAKGII